MSDTGHLGVEHSGVVLSGVTKRYGQVTAVSDLTLSIGAGECFSFLGPSGCGKTTTLRMIAGFEDLDEGEITAGGRLISSSAKKFYLPPEKRDFGMVFQAFAVWPHLSVFENVAFPLRLRKLSRSDIEAKTREALTHTGLAGQERAFPNELSGGEKQRIALARALAVNPQVMLLDEPLSNLDPKLREEMRFEIKDLQRRFGFTIIYVTHDQAEAMALSDRIMVMDQGRVRQVGTPLDVYNSPADAFVFGFIGLSNFIPARIENGAAHAALPPGGWDGPAIGPLTRDIPAGLAPGPVTLACRPTEIDLLPADDPREAPRGVVRRKAFLGEIVDYRVALGSTEVRIQRFRRDPSFETGQAVKLLFHRLLWYPA